MSGTLTDQVASPETEEKVSFSNFEVGGRLGWIFGWLGVGIDYDWKSPKLKFDDRSGTVELDSTVTNFAGFLGLYFNRWMIRLKYNFMADLKADNGVTGITSGDEFSGKGYGIDLGFRFLPWLALNLEYTMNTYDEYNGATDRYELKTSDLLVSLSFPLEFLGAGKKSCCK